MNKKANVITALIRLICWIGLIVCIIWIISVGYKDYQMYKIYTNFCEDKPNFCYCDWFTTYRRCEFKSQWSSQTGLSNETIQLCELAKSLKDKETLFKAGCYNE